MHQEAGRIYKYTVILYTSHTLGHLYVCKYMLLFYKEKKINKMCVE